MLSLNGGTADRATVELLHPDDSEVIFRDLLLAPASTHPGSLRLSQMAYCLRHSLFVSLILDFPYYNALPLGLSSARMPKIAVFMQNCRF